MAVNIEDAIAEAVRRDNLTSLEVHISRWENGKPAAWMATTRYKGRSFIGCSVRAGCGAAILSALERGLGASHRGVAVEEAVAADGGGLFD